MSNNSNIVPLSNSDFHTDFGDTDFQIMQKRKELEEKRLARIGNIQTNTQIASHATISPEEIKEFQEKLGKKNPTNKLFEDDFDLNSVNRNELIKGKSKIEIKLHDKAKSTILTYVRESGARDKKTGKPLLKFEDTSMEYIWNGIFEGPDMRWYQREKIGKDEYVRAPRFASIKVI